MYTTQLLVVQYSADGSEATGTHFIEGDRVARRWPALGDQPSRAIPSKGLTEVAGGEIELAPRILHSEAFPI